jgi:hypothetical protein
VTKIVTFTRGFDTQYAVRRTYLGINLVAGDLLQLEVRWDASKALNDFLLEFCGQIHEKKSV